MTSFIFSQLLLIQRRNNTNRKNLSSSSQAHKPEADPISSEIEYNELSFCRICGDHGDDFTPISNKFEYGLTIMEGIRMLSNIMINESDSNPKAICPNCYSELQKAMSFKKKCEATDLRFRQMFPSRGSTVEQSFVRHDFQSLIRQSEQKRKLKPKSSVTEPKKLKEPVIKSSGRYKCLPCSLRFITREALVAHKKLKQCVRSPCTICGKLVMDVNTHYKHVHSESGRLSCEVCGKIFRSTSGLKSHVLSHTQTYTFSCGHCEFKCKRLAYLRRHMRNHTGDRPYLCALCPATFCDPSNLKKHSLVHSEKIYECAACKKSFKTPRRLKQHTDAIHLNIKYRCPDCRCYFSYRSKLRKHYQDKHGKPLPPNLKSEKICIEVQRNTCEHVIQWR